MFNKSFELLGRVRASWDSEVLQKAAPKKLHDLDALYTATTATKYSVSTLCNAPTHFRDSEVLREAAHAVALVLLLA